MEKPDASSPLISLDDFIPQATRYPLLNFGSLHQPPHCPNKFFSTRWPTIYTIQGVCSRSHGFWTRYRVKWSLIKHRVWSWFWLFSWNKSSSLKLEKNLCKSFECNVPKIIRSTDNLSMKFRNELNTIFQRLGNQIFFSLATETSNFSGRENCS